MSATDPKTQPANEDNCVDDTSLEADKEQSERPKEIGGRGGLDPTRFGDWEKAGRCIDF